MSYKVAVFDAKPYDKAAFDGINQKYGTELL